VNNAKTNNPTTTTGYSGQEAETCKTQWLIEAR